MASENVDQLASRLLASRYGELRCLRQLAVASKNAPALEAAFQEQTGAGSSSEAGPTRRSDQADTAAEELRALSSSRRVSGIGAAFRSRMEAVFAGAQQLGAPRRAASAAPTPRPALARRPSSTAPVAAPPPAPAEPERPAQIIELRRELARLEEAEAVARRLADPRTRARLERVIGSGDRDPATASERVRALRSLLASRRGAERAARPAARRTPPEPLGWRALAAAAAPPPPVPEPPEEGVVAATSTTPSSTFEASGDLRNLQLLQGASFELLLSLQRNIQQELAAALHAAAAAPPAPPVAATAEPAQRGSQGLGACVVCTEAEVSTLFYSCGHLCACARCAFTLKARKAPCPICRAPIRDVVQAYLACAPADAAPTPAPTPAPTASATIAAQDEEYQTSLAIDQVADFIAAEAAA